MSLILEELLDRSAAFDYDLHELLCELGSHDNNADTKEVTGGASLDLAF